MKMNGAWAALALGLCFGIVGLAQAQQGNANAGKAKVAMCQGCHGPDGNSMVPTYPKLAGQPEGYIAKQIKDFKSGARKDPVMSPMAMAVQDKDVADVAAYFASQKSSAGTAVGDTETVALGKKVYRGGNAKSGVSACMSCHGPSGHGIPPRFPRVSGQHAAYMEKQLLQFKNSARANDEGIMTRIAFRMSEAEIKAVSQYMAGVK